MVELVGVANQEQLCRVTPKPSWVKDVEYPTTTEERVFQKGLQELLHDTQVNWETQTLFTREVTRVLNPIGAKNFCTLTLSFDPLTFRLEVHYIRVHRGNRSEDRHLNSPSQFSELPWINGRATKIRLLTYMLEDVRPGDIIEYASSRVLIHNSTQSWDGGCLVYIDYPTSVEVVSFGVHNPHKRYLNARVYNDNPKSSPFDSHEVSEYFWKFEHTKAIEKPSWRKGDRYIALTADKTWADVVQREISHYDLSTPFYSPEMENLIIAWKAKTSSLLELATLAVRFVQDEIRFFEEDTAKIGKYNKPCDPKETFRKRLGCCRDKVLLLHAFFKMIGISSFIVVTHDLETKGFLPAEAPLPMRQLFDHIILKAEIAGKDYWIEATDNCRRGLLQQTNYEQEKWGLVLAPNTTDLVTIPKVKLTRPSHDFFTELKMTSPKGGEKTVVLKFFDNEADAVRGKLYADGSDFFKQPNSRNYKVTDDEKDNCIAISQTIDWVISDKGIVIEFSLLEDMVPSSIETNNSWVLTGKQWIKQKVSVTGDIQLKAPPYLNDETNEFFSFQEGRSSQDANRLDYTVELHYLQDRVSHDRLGDFAKALGKIDASPITIPMGLSQASPATPPTAPKSSGFFQNFFTKIWSGLAGLFAYARSFFRSK